MCLVGRSLFITTIEVGDVGLRTCIAVAVGIDMALYAIRESCRLNGEWQADG